MADNQRDGTTTYLRGFKFSIGHQEMSRIVNQLETIYQNICFNDEGPTGCEWLPVYSIAEIICESLGYEDFDELEDALGGKFEDFLLALPHVISKEENGKKYWRIRQDPPVEEWVKRKMSFRIEARSDLWRVVFKNRNAVFRIPHMEFEISADGVRTVDSIYNLISSAIYKLGDFVRGSKEVNEQSTAVLKCVDELEVLLDVIEPFDVELIDPSGTSELDPMDERVKTEIIEHNPEKTRALEFLLEQEEKLAEANKRVQEELNDIPDLVEQ